MTSVNGRWLAAVLGFTALLVATTVASAVQERILFDGATNKHYFGFRIPSLLSYTSGQTGKQMLMAFAEGRKWCNRDAGDIDTVVRISADGGTTWSKIRSVAGRRRLDAPGEKDVATWGNPTAVYDEITARVWLMINYNPAGRAQRPCRNICNVERQRHCIKHKTEKPIRRGDRRVFIMSSANDGKSWTKPRDVSATVQFPNTAWDAVGPGNGIQLHGRCAAGALVFPAIGRNVYSADHGKTWHTTRRLPGGTSEATIVELSDGSLLRNDRPVAKALVASRRRPVSRSRDCGATWDNWYPQPELTTTRVHGSQIRLRSALGDVLVFANARSPERRRGMTLRLSTDAGESWTAARVAHTGVAAYPSLAELHNGDIGLLYEQGPTGYKDHGKLAFFRGSVKWLANGRDVPVGQAAQLQNALQPAPSRDTDWSNPDRDSAHGDQSWSDPDDPAAPGPSHEPYDPDDIEGLPWLKK